MTASDKANAKAEDAANDRTKEVLKRLDLIDRAIAASGGWSRGVGSSLGTLFQVIASLGVIVGLIVVVIQHRP
jgi:Flp pilus assembly protein TadB